MAAAAATMEVAVKRNKGLASPRATLALAALGLALGACAANTEPDSPGSCALSCAQTRAAASEFEVRPLLSAAGEDVKFDMACKVATGQNVAEGPGPVRVLFKVYQKKQAFAGRAGNDDQLAADDEQSKAGIGFEPMLYGGMATDRTHPEHYDAATKTVTPFKFNGIVTPKAEWCSDSCGIISYEFWPVCLSGQENKIIAGVQAAAAAPKGTYKINYTNRSIADDKDSDATATTP